MATSNALVSAAPSFKRIVVPLSCAPKVQGDELALSVGDFRMFRQALWLAEQCGAELLLIHVVDFVDEHALRNKKSVLHYARDSVLPQFLKLKGLAELRRACPSRP